MSRVVKDEKEVGNKNGLFQAAMYKHVCQKPRNMEVEVDTGKAMSSRVILR